MKGEPGYRARYSSLAQAEIILACMEIFMCVWQNTYLQFHFLKIKNTNLREFVDYIETIVLLVGDRIS